MLYTGDGVYCKFCLHEGATICCDCADILKYVPEKIYETVRNMTPEELLSLEKYLESTRCQFRLRSSTPSTVTAKPIYFQCKTCKGTKEVPIRDYVAMCGYSDCDGVIHRKEDAIEKKRFWRKHWTFKCPVCDKVFGREKLIVWPMVPCPTCQ